MSTCHHVSVSTYIAKPIVTISVDNLKEAFLVRRLQCEHDLLQDVLGPLAQVVCDLPAMRQAGGPSVSQADLQHDPPDLLLSHPVLLHPVQFVGWPDENPPIVPPQPGL